MKALIDTCVVIDMLQAREPFAEDAIRVFKRIAMDEIDGFITAKSVTDIYYLMHRHYHDDAKTRAAIGNLLTIVNLLNTDSDDIRLALLSPVSDFEDAVMVETAIRTGMECIVTRNSKDYAASSIRIAEPSELAESPNL